jgi:hypothetical protein
MVVERRVGVILHLAAYLAVSALLEEVAVPHREGRLGPRTFAYVDLLLELELEDALFTSETDNRGECTNL